MRRLRSKATGQLGLLAGLLLAGGLTAEAAGQVKLAGLSREAKVHRVEIRQGGRVTHLYFGENLSPQDEAKLRELQEAEQRLARLESLAAAREQAAANPWAGTTLPAATPVVGYTGSAYAAFVPANPLTGFPSTFAVYPGTAALPAYSPYPAVLAGTSPVNPLTGYPVTLALGAPAPQQAWQLSEAAEATPQALAQARKELEMARAQVEGVGAGPIRAAAWSAGETLLLRLKDGDKVETVKGTFVGQTKDWFTISTDQGMRHIRPARIQEIIESGKKGVVPAGDK